MNALIALAGSYANSLMKPPSSSTHLLRVSVLKRNPAPSTHFSVLVSPLVVTCILTTSKQKNGSNFLWEIIMKVRRFLQDQPPAAIVPASSTFPASTPCASPSAASSFTLSSSTPPSTRPRAQHPLYHQPLPATKYLGILSMRLTTSLSMLSTSLRLLSLPAATSSTTEGQAVFGVPSRCIVTPSIPA